MAYTLPPAKDTTSQYTPSLASEDIPPLTGLTRYTLPPSTVTVSTPDASLEVPPRPPPQTTLGTSEIAAIVQAGAAVAGVGIAIAAIYLPTRSNTNHPTTAIGVSDIAAIVQATAAVAGVGIGIAAAYLPTLSNASSPTTAIAAAPKIAAIVQAGAAIAGVGVAIAAIYLPSRSDTSPPTTATGEIAAIVQAGAAVAGVGIAIAAAYLPTRSNTGPPTLTTLTTANNCGIISGHVNDNNYQYFSNGKACDISPDLRSEMTKDAVLKAMGWMATGRGGDVCFHIYSEGSWTGVLQVAASGKQVVGGICLYSDFPIVV
ncbi:hypothetical protein BDN72DRAFT_436395 [Pluteus cervinus]|uniref:Uncharacterized protein n=1 Tax=Pluteus cervinus TaxID=181527 RepID=A0ACD3AZN9_9AGAR|nr:hypothetical protein BDN72DRAFT_436395 [Pluteus cervinus]